MKLLKKIISLIFALLLIGGLIANAMDFDEPIDEEEMIDSIIVTHGRVPGDVNYDDDVTNADLILISQYVVGMANFTIYQIERGDINNDGDISNVDVIMVARYLVGLSYTFLQEWSLLDVYGYLYWYDNGSIYINRWRSGAEIWNSYIPGVIREDTNGTIRDVIISDYYTNEDILAITNYFTKSVKFNITKMIDINIDEKIAVAAHECGHCLGIDHGFKFDIMYPRTPWVKQLSYSDKASYDAVWDAFGRPRPNNSNTEIPMVSDNQTENEEIYERDFYKGIPVYYTSALYCINVNNYEELVGDADYVFVGRVLENMGETYENESIIEFDDGNVVLSDPYTNYSVEVLNNIKGTLGSKVELKKYGGLDQSRECYIIMNDDFLPVEGATYIFIAYAQDDGSLHVCGENSTIIYNSDELNAITNAANPNISD